MERSFPTTRRRPAVEIGRSKDTYRRIRIESVFGKMTVFVTDGHLPYPYGRELTGYEVRDLQETLDKGESLRAQSCWSSRSHLTDGQRPWYSFPVDISPRFMRSHRNRSRYGGPLATILQRKWDRMRGGCTFVACGAADGPGGRSTTSTPQRPAIMFNRWQEDWSVLADPRVSREPFDEFKYIPLSRHRSLHLSLVRRGYT